MSHVGGTNLSVRSYFGLDERKLSSSSILRSDTESMGEEEEGGERLTAEELSEIVSGRRSLLQSHCALSLLSVRAVIFLTMRGIK